MEGANYCYEIEMTSNYLLAAYSVVTHGCQLLCHQPCHPLFSPLLFFLLHFVGIINDLRQVWNEASLSLLNVETGKNAVVKQSPVSHRERQLLVVGNQCSFLQINSIHFWSMMLRVFVDVGCFGNWILLPGKKKICWQLDFCFPKFHLVV